MHQKNYLSFAILAVLLLPGLAAGADDEPANPFALHPHGIHLVDEAGRQVMLRGANTGERITSPPFIPFDPTPDFNTALERYADKIQALGFNVVRLLLSYEAAEPVRGRYDEEYLKKYDQMVSAMSRRGLRVIVNGHQDLFSRRFCGDGFPDWALPAEYQNRKPHADCKFWGLHYFSYPVAKSYDRLWLNQDQVRDSYVAFFKMLALRYRNEPAVIGFEPFNEPFPGLRGRMNYSAWYKEQLFVFYEQVAEAVQGVDRRYLFFADICPLENTGLWSVSRPRPEIQNLVFAPHYYDLSFIGISLGPGGDIWFMRQVLNRHSALSRFWQVPMLVGEFGIPAERKEAPEYLARLYSVFDELQLSVTIWEISMSPTLWNLEDFSLLGPDGSERPAAKSVDRPYPRAVAGTIKQFSFSAETRRLELSFAEDPQISLPTEIYLPARWYPGEPQITLEPSGQFRFDSLTRVLSVYPLKEKAQRSIIII